MATIVTALYDIGRDKLIGKHAKRSFSKYLDWFKYVLSINTPMVVFVPEELVEYVQMHRNSSYQTQIIKREFEELDAYKYHDRIQDTINRMREDMVPHFNDCPEFITAKYETIIFSKIDFLKEIAKSNPFHTDYFIWMDAGTFYDNPPFDVSLSWPDPYKIQILQDKFLIPNYCFNSSDRSPLNDKKSYLRRNENGVYAYTLGGSKNAIFRTHKHFWREVDNALELGVINNEQHIMQLMILEKPEDYYLWYPTRRNYNLSIPIKDRMIPAELAIGTHIGENYAIEPKIKLLTLATKEVNPSSYKLWEITAKHYGYNYEIIGRDINWKGFGLKIEAFLNALKNTKEPYVVLTDCTDVFFTGSATELYHKFKKMNVKAVVSGEMIPHYPGDPDHKKVLTKYFDGIKTSAQAYPNSGFIMGKTEDITKLMEIHNGYKDDQVACFDTIYENKFPLVIDYDTVLIGNVPNYKNSMEKAVNYFQFDPIRNRYKNVFSGEYPVVFHFPGKNWIPMQQYFSNSQSNQIIQMTTTDQNGLWIFITILIAIFLIILFINYVFV